MKGNGIQYCIYQGNGKEYLPKGKLVAIVGKDTPELNRIAFVLGKKVLNLTGQPDNVLTPIKNGFQKKFPEYSLENEIFRSNGDYGLLSDYLKREGYLRPRIVELGKYYFGRLIQLVRSYSH